MGSSASHYGVDAGGVAPAVGGDNRKAGETVRPRSICLTLALVAAIAVGLVGPAAAEADNFTCRASALRVTSPLVNSEPVVANRNNDPCADETAQGIGATVPGLVSAGVLNAQTDNRTNGATSKASVANATITLGDRVITATVLQSDAAVTCVGGTPSIPFHPGTPGTPAFSGSSSIATLSISGQDPIVITGQPNQTIAIPQADGSLLTIVINEQIRESDRITVRALRVSSPTLMTEVVVAESIADVSGHHACPVPAA